MTLQKTLATVLAASLALALSPAVMAAKGFSYSYADVGYQFTDGDNGIDINSGRVDASFGIFRYMALRAGFLRGNTDDIPGDNQDRTEFRFGGQLHYPVMKKLDVFGEVLALNSYINSNSSTNVDTGPIYAAGVRFQALKKLELDAGYKYVAADVDNDFGTVGAVFKFTRAFSATANASFGGDINEYFGGIRLNF